MNYDEMEWCYRMTYVDIIINKLTDTEASRDEVWEELIEDIRELLNDVVYLDLDGYLFVCPECGDPLGRK